MSSISDIVDRVRGFDLERTLGLRPATPRVAVELDRDEYAIVRLKRRRRGLPLLEGHVVRRLDEPGVPATLFDQSAIAAERLTATFRELFEASNVRPGRISVVLPDNLAKVALLNLPDRPSSRKQLVELIRFKMHRAVPFRMTDATMTYQELPAEGRGVSILVALVRQALVDRFEHALEAAGARPGLIDLCTPNLLNLCRPRLEAAAAEGGDVALLNCTTTYFSLMIVRRSQLIFYRCKSCPLGDGEAGRANGLLAREMAGSLSYYQEKLGGQGIGTLLVRSVALPFEELCERLTGIGVAHLEPIDPAAVVELPEGLRIDSTVGQRIAPAVGAAAGRS